MNKGRDGTKGRRYGLSSLEVSWGVSASERVLLLTRISRCTATVVQILPLSESTPPPNERPTVHVHHSESEMSSVSSPQRQGERDSLPLQPFGGWGEETDDISD